MMAIIERKPWMCPHCNRGVRGDVETCNHGGGLQTRHDPLWSGPNNPPYAPTTSVGGGAAVGVLSK